MTDYTPTTDEVREWYGDDVTDADRAWELAKRAEFDRWLAAHDEEVLDKAVERVWDEVLPSPITTGWDAGFNVAIYKAIAAIRGEGSE
jgi:hypothetical protein